jgi:hypothetical protein
MENWPGILLWIFCCSAVRVASAGAFLTGIVLLVSRKLANRSIADGEERKSLALPIALIVIGGSITLLYVYSDWKSNYDQKQRETVACQTIVLTDSYKLEFFERRDGTHSNQLREDDIEASSMRTPADDITQLAVVDNYIIGEVRSGYWFIVDLRELRSDRYFSTQEEFAEALGELGLPTTPEMIPADTYCDVEPCQPCPYPAFTQ